MIHEILKKIEQVLCRYLGLERNEITPTSVSVSSSKIIVRSNSSNKRHLMKESWDDFSIFSLQNTKGEKTEKLGLAIGKALAKNLIVKFEPTELQREK